MSIDVGYLYCTRLTEEEKQLIDETTRKNRIELIILLMLIFSELCSSPARAVPLPGANGFTPPPPRCRPNRGPCRNYGIVSRTSTSACTNVNRDDPNGHSDRYFDESLNCLFENKQLQKKFKHAKYFGISGNYNQKNVDLFRKKLIEHMNSTHACLGTYRGHDVYH